MRRPHSLVLLAVVAGAGGLALLFIGLADGVPLVFWGTAEERAAREEGRAWILLASALLVVAGALLGARRGVAYGIAAAAAGPVTAALAFALPGTAWAWLGFLLLAPVTLGATLAALLAPVDRRETSLQ